MIDLHPTFSMHSVSLREVPQQGYRDESIFFENTQTDRQAGRQAGRQTDRQTDRQTEKIFAIQTPTQPIQTKKSHA